MTVKNEIGISVSNRNTKERWPLIRCQFVLLTGKFASRENWRWTVTSEVKPPHVKEVKDQIFLNGLSVNAKSKTPQSLGAFWGSWNSSLGAGEIWKEMVLFSNRVWFQAKAATEEVSLFVCFEMEMPALRIPPTLSKLLHCRKSPGLSLLGDSFCTSVRILAYRIHAPGVGERCKHVETTAFLDKMITAQS